jgi:hypothetical protein
MLAAKSKKKEVNFKMDTTLHDGEPVKAPPVVEEDDKPLTMRQYKALMQEKAESKVAAPPKRKYTRKPKPPTPAPTPAPSPTPQKPAMIFV